MVLRQIGVFPFSRLPNVIVLNKICVNSIRNESKRNATSDDNVMIAIITKIYLLLNQNCFTLDGRFDTVSTK